MLYANVTAAVREFPNGTVEQVGISEEEMKRLQEAQNVFRDLSARMPAFALNEKLAVWFVTRQYDPWEASEALLGVSNTLYKSGNDRANAQSRLAHALSFRITR
jgi:trehalose-6-phosphatase